VADPIILDRRGACESPSGGEPDSLVAALGNSAYGTSPSDRITANLGSGWGIGRVQGGVAVIVDRKVSLVVCGFLVLLVARAQASEGEEEPTDAPAPTEAEAAVDAEAAEAAAKAAADKIYEEGARIAAMGNGQGSTACAVCHNMDGAGRSASGIPRLARQDSSYMFKQLQDYKSGQRPHFAMEQVVATLTDEQMQAVAAYYSRQTGEVVAEEPATKQMALGYWIAERGIAEKDVAPCTSCHGPDGQGIAPVFPRLAGQSSAYAREQLEQLQEGTRANDPGNMMAAIAKKLSKEEIKAVSAYFETIELPGEVHVPQAMPGVAKGTISLGEPRILGDMERDQADSVVQTKLVQVTGCYARQKTADSGELVVRLVVGKDGTVSRASVKDSTHEDGKLESCVLEQLQALEFSALEGKVILTYPFEFLADD
ncbi:MAG: AgmX/PglI C-terminal domain-containing protein, partial [Myxococcota bacterium]|nr:AgmX/PglI C-terminal domain-containing protein [Myxococcota bacterium]